MSLRWQWCWSILLSPVFVFSQTSTLADELPRFVRLETSALDASVRTRKHPALPPLPANLGISTTAVLDLIVDERGIVRSVRPAAVPTRLRDRAVQAARQWTFSPPRPDGKPALVVGRITLEFTPHVLVPDSPEIEQARIAAERDSRNPALQYALAKLYHEAERYEEAIDALLRCVGLKPDFEEACVLLGATCGRIERFDDQISAYTRYLAVKPDSTAVLDALARCYMERTRYRDAILVLEKLERLTPVDASVLLRLGQAHARLGQFEDAVRVYGRALELHPDDAALRANLGHELFRAGRFREAEPELVRAVGLDAGQRLAYHSLGDVYALTGRAAKALETYRTCVEKAHPDFQNVEVDYHRLGAISTQLEQYAQAIHFLEQGLELKPDFGELYCDLGRIQSLQGNDERSVEILRKGLALRPDVPCLHGFLGVALMSLDRLDEAEAALQRVIQMAPQAPFGYLQLAEVQSRAGKWEEAHATLRRVQALAPNEFRVHLALAQLYSRTDKPVEGERELRAALRLEPTNPTVLNNFGYFLAELGKDLQEALKMTERAVAADPRNAAFLDSLGWVHFRLGRIDLAEKYITESMKLGRKSSEVAEHLGDVYRTQGKLDAAREKWREALALRPDRRQRARLNQKLTETGTERR